MIRGEMTNVGPAPCPLCQTMQGAGPATMRDEEAAIRDQIRHLEERRNQLQMGQITPEQVQDLMPGMCPLCVGLMAGTGPHPSRQEIDRRLQHGIAELTKQLDALKADSS